MDSVIANAVTKSDWMQELVAEWEQDGEVKGN